MSSDFEKNNFSRRSFGATSHFNEMLPLVIVFNKKIGESLQAQPFWLYPFEKHHFPIDRNAKWEKVRLNFSFSKNHNFCNPWNFEKIKNTGLMKCCLLYMKKSRSNSVTWRFWAGRFDVEWLNFLQTREFFFESSNLHIVPCSEPTTTYKKNLSNQKIQLSNFPIFVWFSK